MNDGMPVSWDYLDDTRRRVAEKIVKDKDQDPLKKWGPYGWSCHATEEHVQMASTGKTTYLSDIVGFQLIDIFLFSHL